MDNTLRRWLLVAGLWAVLVSVDASTKKGICGWGGSYFCDDFKHLNNMTWMYDWHGDLSQLYDKHMRHINCSNSHQYLPEYVPMVYTLGDSPGHQKNIHHTTNVTKNVKFILGFNEPNHVDQANMSPREAADRWPEIERDNPGILLVSPAPAGHDFHWLDTFFHLCKGCRVDYVAAHSYRCNTNEIMTFLHQLYQRHGKKIWLTEFACPYTTDRNVQLNFMKEILPRLEAADYVFRYAWFQARITKALDNAFMMPSASLFWPNSAYLTPLGHYYNDFQGNGHSPGYDWHNGLEESYDKYLARINCSTPRQYLPEYVPMIFTFSNASGHQKWLHHTTNVSQDARFVLTFNEPNHVDQANMSPQDAAARWPEIERDNPGIPLVSPAPAGYGHAWLDSFFHLCKGCRVDYVAAHSYNCNANEVMSFLQNLYHRYGKKIWLTEFACPHTNDRNVQLKFMKEILPRLEAADYVFRYAWFSARILKTDGWVKPSASLFWAHSSYLTPLGSYYNRFQGHHSSAHLVG